MGELRENENSLGFWSRIYNGQQKMDFSTGSSINYTSLQLGFDGDLLKLKDSNLYIGTAFTYSFGKNNFNNVRPYERAASVLNSSTLNSLDLALYVSYVEYGEKGGLYSDTILKGSYVMNSLATTGSDRYNTNTGGVSFSQEVGYRMKHHSGFFFDPQAELSYAYLGKQSFAQSYTDHTINYTESAKYIQDRISTFRARFGVNWGFDFKNFFEKDLKANAKLYLGTYYVYDYISGGEITIDNLDFIKQRHIIHSTPYFSTGRAVLNVGTNVSFKDGTRLYLDFERSFGGKITTEYQVNLGVRIGFGEKIEKRKAVNTTLDRSNSTPVKTKEEKKQVKKDKGRSKVKEN